MNTHKCYQKIEIQESYLRQEGKTFRKEISRWRNDPILITEKFSKKIRSEISREISTKIKKKTAVSEDDSVAKGI